MFVYVSKTFRTAVSGAATRRVECEKCQCTYVYQLVRRGDGAASAPYYIGQSTGPKRAENKARAALDRRLRKGVDPVPCPDCGWLQTDMVRELRRRHLRWLLKLGWWLLAIGGIVFVTCAILASSPIGYRHPQEDRMREVTIAALALAAMAAPFAIRVPLQRWYDPNKNYPEKPDPIPGMPKGFKLAADGTMLPPPLKDGQSQVPAYENGVLTYERSAPAVEPGGWVTVQLLRIVYPTACCSCLDATDNLRLYPTGRLTKVPVRICEPCRKRESSRLRNLTILAAFLCGLAGAGIGYFASDVQNQIAIAVSLGIGLGIVGAVVGALVGTGIFASARFSRFSTEFNTIRIRFRNRSYTTPFAEANQMA